MRSSGDGITADEVEAALIADHHDAHVDMVLRQLEPDVYRAACATGSVVFRRSVEWHDDVDGSPVQRPTYTVEATTGTDPLRSTSTDQLVGYDAEAAGAYPHRDANAYPHAHDQIAQFFDAEHAPDLVAQHTAAHRFGKNVGEHGSLGIVQARAPFIMSGAGVTALGRVERSARMIDVAPTIMRLLGGSAHPSGVGPTGAPRPGALLGRQDGDPLDDLVEPGAARHLVVILLDGCNANALHRAIDHGEVPAIASLAEAGTTFGHGLMASLPTATLANHTTASTGAHPGHSGVLHNMWLNRTDGSTPDLLAMDQMFDAMVHLDPAVETIHQAVHRTRPDAFTASVFEFCDTGADVSSFADFRAGRPPALPPAATLPEATAEFIGSSGAYSFMSSVDEYATRQAVDLWRRSAGGPLPDLTFLSLALTDESGHEGGPHSDIARAGLADSDRRVARLLDAVQQSGAAADTAFVLLADHGMEASDPSHDLPWHEVVTQFDGHLVDVASGFLYLR